MEPASLTSALAKAIMSQLVRQLAGPALTSVKTRVLGDPERKALEQALDRAFGQIRQAYGHQLADFDVNPDFWQHEGATELAKVLLPGARPSPAALARRAVGSLGTFQSDDEQLDRINLLRPVFKAFLDALSTEVRREPALQALLHRSDEAHSAQATGRLAEQSGAAGAGEDDLLHYLTWLIDQHRYLPTVGVVRNTTVRLPLTEVFVGLQAQVDRRPGDRAREWFTRERDKLTALMETGQLDQTGFEAALDRLQLTYGRKFPADGERDETPVLPVLDTVGRNAQLLVLGDPGSGKTTLLRYLALTHAKARIADPTDPATRLPIYLRIGEYAQHGYPRVGIGEFLIEHLRRHECRTPGLADLLQRHLDTGRCLVLLDGLDEIASAELRRGVVAAVVNFVTAHARQGNRFVVTSRISGYQAAPLPDSFHAVRLTEMDDATIEAFLEVYCREVEQAETPERSPSATREAAAREAAAIGAALKTTPGVRRLAANPLLLTALVLVHRSSGRLPHRRVEAYIEVCHALGRTWRSAQGVAEADLPDERILNRWLARLGAWLHEHRPEGAASKLELLEVLGPLWAAHHGSPWDPQVLRDADPLDTDPGRGVLDFVRKVDAHTGLLVERAPGRYGFAHLTFEEYYTGRALALLGSIENRASEIRRRLHDPRYDEPILLALGLIGTDYAEQIDEVVAQAIYPGAEPSEYEDLLGRDFLFMLRVLADDVPLTRTATIDEILHQAIEEYLHRDFSRCRFTAYRKALIQRLRGLGGTRAGERLRVALDAWVEILTRHPEISDGPGSERWCELVEIVAAHGPLLPVTRDRLVWLAADLSDAYRAVRAMEVLAQQGALTENVIAAALMLRSDWDPIVQDGALGALHLGHAFTPKVVEAVTELATSADDSWIRVRAVEVLVRRGLLTEEVTSAVVGMAAEQPDDGARAVAELAWAGVWTGEVITSLVGLATGAGSLGSRVTAAYALATGGQPTPEVTAALAGLATGVAASEVRVVAVEGLARQGRLTGEVVVSALEVATSPGDPETRARAIKVLAEDGRLTDAVVVAAVELATGPGDPAAKARANTLLAAYQTLTVEVIAALVRLATAEGEDLSERVQAMEVLGEFRALGGEVVAAAVGVATGEHPPDLRARAMGALAAAGLLTGAVAATAQEIIAEPEEWWIRRDLVRYLRHAPPTKGLIGTLMARFRDRSEQVWTEVGNTLVEISRRHPEVAADIRSRLAVACTYPLMPRDFVYQALHRQVEAIG
ncbi:HEAT repeat domain-containing protein [Micromonospora gifhornensis]|uniref:NTPase n=1 Tax=Micromonospora gifhornensis TaxID=84594 RepID=A0ABQ4I7A7_9ACTN|nr:NACHT domain-containing protein [Micromonospora gifhornensis]GIJ13763.1 NTPase [Micromonospora gifhornensis]